MEGYIAQECNAIRVARCRHASCGGSEDMRRMAAGGTVEERHILDHAEDLYAARVKLILWYVMK